ncbi:MAG: lysophospholipid acyltransferase family protein [Holophagaceae bacterium]|nr:lysophospholipid acyltransferase family protein [Holophagaceae bacterium]
MQSDSKVLDLVYGGVFGTLFPMFLFAARTFEHRERGFEIADQVMEAFIALRPKYLDAVCGNMAQVLGLPPEHPEVRRVAVQAIRQHAYSWVDFFRFGQRSVDYGLSFMDAIEGREHLDASLAEGRGVILLTAHLGSYEVGGMLLRSRGTSIHAVYKPDRFAPVEKLRTRMRENTGVIGIPVGEGFATLPLVKVLREGGLVGMQGDRDFSLNGLPIPFFGREAFFPRGPWELAAMTGAAIVPAFFFTNAEHRFMGHFEAPIHVLGGRGERMRAIETGMREYVAHLEQLVREHPDQWYCFYPFWDDPKRQAEAQKSES